jgi:hypothetical protein
LLSDFDNQSYYILILFTIKAAKEEFPGINDAKAKVKGSKEVKIATSDKIGKECDNNKDSNVDCSNNTLFEGELSSDNKHLSDNKTLSNSRLLSKELLSDTQNLLGDDLSNNKLLLANNPLSKSKILLNNKLILDEHKLEPTNKDDNKKDEIYGDDKDYNTYKGEGCKECARCKECEECKKCEECEECECEGCECEGCDSKLQDVMEQHKHLKHFAKGERTKEARDIAKPESEPKHHEFVRSRAFDIGYQQSEPNGEQVSTATVFRTC